MVRKNAFPEEPKTVPDAPRGGKGSKKARGPSRREPETAHERALASTLPPPPDEANPHQPVSVSKVRPVQPDLAGATVDEVTADLTKDPRRE